MDDQSSSTPGGSLHISRVYPSGGASTIVTYPDGVWTMMSFSSVRSAQEFAFVNNMEVTYSEEVEP